MLEEKERQKTSSPAKCNGCEKKDNEISRLREKLQSSNGKLARLTQLIQKADAEKKALSEQLALSTQEKEDAKSAYYSFCESYHQKTHEAQRLHDELLDATFHLKRKEELIKNFAALGVFARLSIALSRKKIRTEFEL